MRPQIANLQLDGCRYGSDLPWTGRCDTARHPAPLRGRHAVGLASRRRLPHELRRGAEARGGARAGRPRGQGAARARVARPHGARRGAPGPALARSARRPVARPRRSHVECPRRRREPHMTVTTVDTDLDARTLTLVAEFDAPVERVWQLWSDPRKLERWWGPPSYPATFERHELEPGGTVGYFMTSPEGERFHGVWRVVAVDPPRSLDVEDSFADPDGNVNSELPTGQMRMRLTEDGGRTRMELVSIHATIEDLQQVLDMGQAEGMKQAMGQMDAILAE